MNIPLYMVQYYKNMAVYWAMGFYALCICAFSFFMYYQNKTEIMESADSRLYADALCIPLIMGKHYADTPRHSLPDKEEYAQKVQRLTRYADITHLKHICQLQMRQETLYVVACVNLGGLAHAPMRPYPDAVQAPLHALRTGKPVYTSADGDNGAMRVLFLPVLQASGETHIVGIARDMQISEDALRAEILEIFGYGLILPLFALPLIFFANRGLRIALRDLCIINHNLATINAKYKELSYSDTLTRLPNRRAFYENGQRAVGHCVRTSRPLHVLALDLDHFKHVNDTYGHSVGDTVLIGFAQILSECLRAGDVVGRCGGEEFGVLLPETDLQNTLDVAERLRATCAARQFFCADGIAFNVSVSVGVAQLEYNTDNDATSTHSVSDLLNDAMRHADAALYIAKQNGRNRVCVYGEDGQTAHSATSAIFFSI